MSFYTPTQNKVLRLALPNLIRVEALLACANMAPPLTGLNTSINCRVYKVGVGVGTIKVSPSCRFVLTHRTESTHSNQEIYSARGSFFMSFYTPTQNPVFKKQHRQDLPVLFLNIFCKLSFMRFKIINYL